MFFLLPPAIVLPDVDPVSGVGRREITLSETGTQFEKEGLAAKNAQNLLHNIVYILLLNRLIPCLDFWPKLQMLQIVQFESL